MGGKLLAAELVANTTITGTPEGAIRCNSLKLGIAELG